MKWQTKILNFSDKIVKKLRSWNYMKESEVDQGMKTLEMWKLWRRKSEYGELSKKYLIFLSKKKKKGKRQRQRNEEFYREKKTLIL